MGTRAKVGDNLYRARLNRSDCLLFSIYRYEGCVYALLLEYDLFQRYLSFLQQQNLYDTNLICHAYLSLAKQK